VRQSTPATKENEESEEIRRSETDSSDPRWCLKRAPELLKGKGTREAETLLDSKLTKNRKQSLGLRAIHCNWFVYTSLIVKAASRAHVPVLGSVAPFSHAFRERAWTAAYC